MAYFKRNTVCINLKKTSQLKSQINITNSNDFQFGEALESVYPLLELIFNYLDYNDLRSVAAVKRSWHDIVQNILEKRNKISWLTVFRRRRQVSVYHNDNFGYNNTQIGIIIFNDRIISLSDKVCCHENDHCQSDKLKFSEILAQQIVPQGINYCIIACTSVSSYFSKDIVTPKTTIFDGLFLPPIPNVRVALVYCSIHDFDSCIKPNQRIKCLLLLSKYYLEEDIYRIIERFIPEQEWKSCAFGGGVIHRTLVHPKIDRSGSRKLLDNLCLCFTEDRGIDSCFDAASIVIKILTIDEYEEQLLAFKRRIVMRSNSFALKFCCSAISKKTQGCKVFNKLFPNTPLLGLDVEGEFGWNCTSAAKANDDAKTKKTKHVYPTTQHQWSTVIVLFTWGRILNSDS